MAHGCMNSLSASAAAMVSKSRSRSNRVWPQLDFFLNWASELGICLYEVSLFFMYKKTLLPPMVQGSGILNQPHLFQLFIYIK